MVQQLLEREQTRIKFLNPFPNKPCFLRVCSSSLLKTLWEKKKLLVASNFSFSHIVFYSFGELSAIFIKFEIVIRKLFQFGRVEFFSFGKGSKAYSYLCFLFSYKQSEIPRTCYTLELNSLPSQNYPRHAHTENSLLTTNSMWIK